jgi:hypothetical protein
MDHGITPDAVIQMFSFQDAITDALTSTRLIGGECTGFPVNKVLALAASGSV